MSIPENSPLRILVAEDHAINRHLVERMLAKLGHSCDLVTDGIDALAALQRESYDIVLMDLDMPRLDGIETTRQIRALPQYAKTPRIIAVTANHSDKVRVVCLASGMNEYLTKPIVIEDLQAVIEGRRSPTTERRETMLRLRLEELEDIGDIAFVDELISIFRTETTQRLQQVGEVLQANDLAAAGRLFHQLQGSSANMGASEMHRVCTIGEEACREGDAILAKGCQRLAEEEIPLVEAIYAEWGHRELL